MKRRLSLLQILSLILTAFVTISSLAAKSADEKYVKETNIYKTDKAEINYQGETEVYDELDFVTPVITGISEDSCDWQTPGNVNEDASDAINISDVLYLIAYLTRHGYAPPTMANGDPDGDCDIDWDDVRYLVAYIEGYGPPPVDCTCQNPPTTGCCVEYRGNADFVGSDYSTEDKVNISDITFLVAYLFGDGPAPDCREEANADGDSEETVSITDITFLVAYLFNDGPSPGECPVW